MSLPDPEIHENPAGARYPEQASEEQRRNIQGRKKESPIRRVKRLHEQCRELLHRETAKAFELATESLEILRSVPEKDFRSPRQKNTLFAHALSDMAVCAGMMAEFAFAEEKALLALEIFDGLDDSENVAALSNVLANICEYTGRADEALVYHRNALRIRERLGQKDKIAATLSNIAGIYSIQGKFAEAQEHFLLSLEMLSGSEEYLTRTNIYNNLGILYKDLGDYDAAIRYYQQGLDSARRAGSMHMEAAILNNIGLLLLHNGDTDSAGNFFLESLERRRRLQDTVGEAKILNNLAILHYNRKNFSEALRFHEDSIVLNRKIGNFRGEAIARHGIAKILVAQKSYDSAAEFYNEALQFFLREDDLHWILIINRDIAELQLMLGNHREAERISLDLLEKARQIGSLADISHSCELLARIYEQEGEFEKAYKFYKQYHDSEKRIFSQESDSRIRRFSVQFDLERAQKEREIMRLQNVQLRTELEANQRELSSMALHLLEKQEFIERLRSEVQKKSAREKDSLLEELLSANSAIAGREWKIFEEQFDTLSQDFIGRISSRFPKLSVTEVRVCALLRLQLSTKDIAKILFVSERAIEKHRYNIRKKISLPAEQNLSVFLASL